jgi:Spy/CpxP family protein refolding chaperone
VLVRRAGGGGLKWYAIHEAAKYSTARRSQLKANHEALAAAVKAGDVAQIRTLSAQQGNLCGQMLDIRSEAMSKFYATLTPEHRTQADQTHQKMHQRMQRMSKRNNG